MGENETWTTRKIIFHEDDFAKQYVWDGLLHEVGVPADMRDDIYEVELTIIPQMCRYSKEAEELGKKQSAFDKAVEIPVNPSDEQLSNKE